MMMMTKLNEGLRRDDLKDLVLPLLSIDEFDSKVTEDAIVVGFFVKDQDPANDLNRFIQKSPVSLLDTEVSPAPNEDGYFLVFVEFLRDESFQSKLKTILDEVANLVDIKSDDWSFSCYGHDGTFDATEKNLYVLVRTEPLEVLVRRAEDETFGEVLEFLQHSMLTDARIVNETIELHTQSRAIHAKLIAFGEDALYEANLTESAVNLDSKSLKLCGMVRGMLGPLWDVSQINETLLLSNYDSDKILCVEIIPTSQI